MESIGVTLYCLFFGFLTAYVAERKGYDSRSWFGMGVVFGVIASVLVIFQPKWRGNRHSSS
jgi:ABC-type spermidine/putrescine transport system permease subunit I